MRLRAVPAASGAEAAGLDASMAEHGTQPASSTDLEEQRGGYGSMCRDLSIGIRTASGCRRQLAGLAWPAQPVRTAALSGLGRVGPVAGHRYGMQVHGRWMASEGATRNAASQVCKAV